MPAAPSTSQATQTPVQALLQQTPSTQDPELHWLPSAHGRPLASLSLPPGGSRSLSIGSAASAGGYPGSGVRAGLASVRGASGRFWSG